MRNQFFENGNLTVENGEIKFNGENGSIFELGKASPKRDLTEFGKARITMQDGRLDDLKFHRKIGRYEIALSFRFSEYISGDVDIRVTKDDYDTVTPKFCKGVPDYNGSNGVICNRRRGGSAKAISVYGNLIPKVAQAALIAK